MSTLNFPPQMFERISYSDLKSQLIGFPAPKLLVAFSSFIDNQEGYFDSGMMAKMGQLVACKDDGTIDEYLIIEMNISEYEEHNDSVERKTYFDNYGNAILGSREAGMYPKNCIETVYIGKLSFDQEPEFFVIKEGADISVVKNELYLLRNK